MAEGDEAGPFVPVEKRALASIGHRAGAVEAATRETRAAMAALLELADDYRRDAVRRLQERGGSEAQVARYEGSLDAARRAVHDALSRLDEASAALQEDADALR